MSEITIFHNPACGTGRNTLALIRHAGIEPTVIEYLNTPPSKKKQQSLGKAMGIPVRGLLREKGTPYAELKPAVRSRSGNPSGPESAPFKKKDGELIEDGGVRRA